jgi:hypothetical protein
MKREPALVVLVLVGAAALWLLRRRPFGGREPIPSVSTDMGFDLSPYGGPTTYPAAIQNFAQAIARQEGFYVKGSVPARAHNPGDLKIPGAAVLPGTSITVFESDDAGWDALYHQLYLILAGRSDYYSLDMSIEEMSRVWTATQQAPWATNVASYLGVPVTARLWEVLA